MKKKRMDSSFTNEEETEVFPAQLLQKYCIEKLVGEGSYGKVWRAVEKRTGRIVAVKGFFDLFRDCIDAKRVLREITLLGMIKHNHHIIQLLDIICPDDIFNFDEVFIVLEWGDCDLRSYLRSHPYNFLPLVMVKRIMYQILLGIATCKRYGIIHRDIKPANIVIMNENIKLCDFGLSREVNSVKVKNCNESKRRNYDDLVLNDDNDIQANYGKDFGKQTRHSLAQTSKPSNMSGEMISEKQTLKKKPPADKIKTSIVSVGSKRITINTSDEISIDTNKLDQISKFIEKQNSLITPEFRHTNRFLFEKPPLKKSLTHHIVTRWYRAPEVILLEEYDYKIDVWSAGCVFGELLGMTYGSSLQGTLFPGKSCYPMSPIKKPDGMMQNEKEENLLDVSDQLNLIFNLLGTPEEKDLEFLTHQDRKKYLKNFGKIKKTDFSVIFPEATNEAIDLLNKMLAFNPKERFDVEDCLQHPFFEKLGFVEKLPRDIDPIYIDFDHDHLHLSSYDIRALILREVNKFNKIKDFDEIFGFIINEILTIAKTGNVDYV